jgi:4-amino-4-deoxy-L-arabinose transferase-like glycosyltransferase
MKIYRSGFKARRPFMPTTAFLTDTGISYWRRVSHWHRHFLLTPRFFLTPAFLTDTGVSYWHWCFLPIPDFLTDTGEPQVLIQSPDSYQNQRRWDRPRAPQPVAVGPAGKVWTWTVCTEKGTFFFLNSKYQAERVQSHQYIGEKLRKSIIFVCVDYIVNLVQKW